MNHIKTLYDLISEQHPNKLTKHIRNGDLSPLHPLPLDLKTAADLMSYAKQQEADKIEAPYLLSDYIYYMTDGTPAEFAKQLEVPAAHIEQSIYSGCYWHAGQILRPDGLGKDLVYDFLEDHILYGEGKAHFAALWLKYVAYAERMGQEHKDKRTFKKQVRAEFASRGYAEVMSVRIGTKVACGYKCLTIR